MINMINNVVYNWLHSTVKYVDRYKLVRVLQIIYRVAKNKGIVIHIGKYEFPYDIKGIRKTRYLQLCL